MKTLSLKCRRIISNMLKAFSLTGVMFAFQSCYGMPPCEERNGVLLTGNVSDKNKNGIEGIRVSVVPVSADTSEYYRYRFGITNDKGNYAFYVCRWDLGNDNLLFEDIDSAQNGLFASEAVKIQYSSQNEIEISVILDELPQLQ
ncbi:MAG: carboxypeptidase-like regulatory domain-containing protein [Bacteroidales bacterium]|jgi:putative lipoprotein (rSAM/lipoprotein system)|nr:carboxypeptidase-like regulatory domain-containing protein [Bacteroidales bacterium]